MCVSVLKLSDLKKNIKVGIKPTIIIKEKKKTLVF